MGTTTGIECPDGRRELWLFLLQFPLANLYPCVPRCGQP